jgi:(1->4)-alpha-D-glucan 1-alpha-D-glucosylmutase
MYIPSATYRLQFNSAFGFEEAEKIVCYLADLGVDTVYASPIFKARKKSAHGYDVVDPNEINPEIGSRSQFQALIERLRSHQIGWLQDFVPNHMAYDSANQMLMDIFEKGTSSPYFGFFDVVWDHLRENLRGKIIAPFLGSPYSEALERGEISLQYDGQSFLIRYYETAYPVRVETYATIINHRFETLKQQLGEEHPDFVKALGIVSTLESLPGDEGVAESRNAQISVAKEMLAELYQSNEVVREFIDENITLLNADADLLDAILGQQWFRLTYWKLATKEINYQRFFNINELISLRMEDPAVFDHIHRLVFELLGHGAASGLRIDHLDGLYDPTKYLLRLREKAQDAFIVVEKILEFSEQLPSAWPVQGTTGYEFLNYVNGLFVDQAQKENLTFVYTDFTGAASYDDLLYEKKKQIIERHLMGDLDNLTYVLKKISTTTRQGIDLAWIGLKTALADLAALFPVYRIYTDGREVLEQGRKYIEEAIEKAKARNPALTRELDFIEKVLWIDLPAGLSEEDKELWRSFVMRFQQFTSPLMAKGLEDTSFYVFNRLVSLNEVGGNPGRFGFSTDEFHEFNLRRFERHPHTLNTTSTHDTKRSEDVRSRIDVLSEMADEWRAHVRQWSEENFQHKKIVKGQEVPDRNEEYLLYQTLIGAFPPDPKEHEDFIERIKGYMIKALREAKVHSFWSDSNLEYEAAMVEFVETILRPSPRNHFLINFIRFEKKTAFYGALNSLSQTLVKITSPGVPDLYQGSELWDLSLVDPDNRRAVDFGRRAELLRQIKEREQAGVLKLIEEMLSSREDGRVKLFTIYRALGARKKNRRIFDEGEYIPLKVTGPRRDHVIAFARRSGARWALVAAPRFLAKIVHPEELPLGERVWRKTIVDMPDDAPAVWRNVFTDQTTDNKKELPVSELFRHFPVALLIGRMKDN